MLIVKSFIEYKSEITIGFNPKEVFNIMFIYSISTKNSEFTKIK